MRRSSTEHTAQLMAGRLENMIEQSYHTHQLGRVTEDSHVTVQKYVSLCLCRGLTLKSSLRSVIKKHFSHIQDQQRSWGGCDVQLLSPIYSNYLSQKDFRNSDSLYKHPGRLQEKLKILCLLEGVQMFHDLYYTWVCNCLCVLSILHLSYS